MSTSDLRKYFNQRKPSGAICFLTFGILFLFLGSFSEGIFVYLLIGIILITYGTYLIIQFNKLICDVAIDNFCDNISKEYHSCKKTIVQTYDDNICRELNSSAYNFSNLFTARLARKGKDNVWRSSIYDISSIFFTEEKVYYYNKTISLITNENLEKTKEFNLSDVQMVAIEEFNNSIVVVLAIPGNDKISIYCQNRESALELRNEIEEKICR